MRVCGGSGADWRMAFRFRGHCGGRAAMGYQAVKGVEEALQSGTGTEVFPLTRSVQLTMEDSQVVSDTLLRGESFTMEREGVTASFRVDGRGACIVHMSGQGQSDRQLEAAGHELMDRVRQQFAYAKVMAELEERGFQVCSRN